MEKDFEDFDGNYPNILTEINDWMKESNPGNPIVVILCQDGDYIHIRIYFSYYKNQEK